MGPLTSTSLSLISPLFPPFTLYCFSPLCSFPSRFLIFAFLFGLLSPFSLLSGHPILLFWFLDLPSHLSLSVPLFPGPSLLGLQDSCLCLQCTFSDPCGCKRGAGCTVWDSMKTKVLGQLFFSSLHPVSTLPPLAPKPQCDLYSTLTCY